MIKRDLKETADKFEAAREERKNYIHFYDHMLRPWVRTGPLREDPWSMASY